MREEVGKGGEGARYGVRLETCNWERAGGVAPSCGKSQLSQVEFQSSFKLDPAQGQNNYRRTF